jgi:hypothetical protein
MSDQIDTVRGEQQGQIGSDFVFAMINDDIDPENVLDEIIDRIKYVDDFTDIIAHDTVEGVFKSLKHNERRLHNQATSVGLKLNLGKLKILPLNIKESEYDPEYLTRGPDGTSVYCNDAMFLGFHAEIVNPPHLLNLVEDELELAGLLDPIISPEPVELRKAKKPRNSKISGKMAAANLISRLNQSIRTIATLRKFEKDIGNLVKAATALAWSNCYDLGLILAYCGEKSPCWKQVCVTIRRLLKSAGLDYMMDSSVLYKVSLKMDPLCIARKQIIQAGIKLIDHTQLHDRSFKVIRTYGDEKLPFRYRFLFEFNNLPLDLRKFISDNLDPLDRLKMDKIRTHLKSHFIREFDPECPATGISKEKRNQLLSKNLYTQAKVQKRKRAAEALKAARVTQNEKRNQALLKKSQRTPCPRRKAHSTSFLTPKVVRQQALCLAPIREPNAKRHCDVASPTNLSTSPSIVRMDNKAPESPFLHRAQLSQFRSLNRLRPPE